MDSRKIYQEFHDEVGVEEIYNEIDEVDPEDLEEISREEEDMVDFNTIQDLLDRRGFTSVIELIEKVYVDQFNVEAKNHNFVDCAILCDKIIRIKRLFS